MTLTFAVTVHTSDNHTGAELVDAVLSAMLGRGFALLTTQATQSLVELPVLQHWNARVTATHARSGSLDLELGTAEEVIYAGDLGSGVPAGWSTALLRRGLLVVLVCSGVDLSGSDRTDRIRDAIRAGQAVAAQVPARVRQ